LSAAELYLKWENLCHQELVKVTLHIYLI
jgi:hypothetical protein